MNIWKGLHQYCRVFVECLYPRWCTYTAETWNMTVLEQNWSSMLRNFSSLEIFFAPYINKKKIIFIWQPDCQCEINNSFNPFINTDAEEMYNIFPATKSDSALPSTVHYSAPSVLVLNISIFLFLLVFSSSKGENFTIRGLESVIKNQTSKIFNNVRFFEVLFRPKCSFMYLCQTPIKF